MNTSPFLIAFIEQTVEKAKSIVTCSSLAGSLVPPRISHISLDPLIKSEVFVNETIDFYIWIKNNLSEKYVDETCDDELFKKTIKSQLNPVLLLIQISPPTDDPFELFPLPSEIIHILGSENSVGLEKDTFNLIDSNTLEWTIEYASEPLKLEKKDVWYIVPTRLTESIFKGCKK